MNKTDKTSRTVTLFIKHLAESDNLECSALTNIATI